MTIEVTQNDIDNGKRRDCYRCPIAHAINRAMGTHLAADVQETVVELPGREEACLPDQAISFIEDFDAKIAVQPFTFELPI